MTTLLVVMGLAAPSILALLTKYSRFWDLLIIDGGLAFAGALVYGLPRENILTTIFVWVVVGSILHINFWFFTAVMEEWKWWAKERPKPRRLECGCKYDDIFPKK